MILNIMYIVIATLYNEFPCSFCHFIFSKDWSKKISIYFTLAVYDPSLSHYETYEQMLNQQDLAMTSTFEFQYF